MSVLAVRSLSKSFGGVRAVNDVSFEIAQGEFLAMIGPNGAGKSTCFNMINGQLLPDAGEILFENRDISGLKSREVWRLGVGRTFQVAATFGSMTVAENVQMALISHVTRQVWQMAKIEHRDRDENDISDCDNSCFGRRELSGENSAHNDERNHQRYGSFLGCSGELTKCRALAFNAEWSKEMAVNHQPDTDEYPWHNAAKKQPAD